MKPFHRFPRRPKNTTFAIFYLLGLLLIEGTSDAAAGWYGPSSSRVNDTPGPPGETWHGAWMGGTKTFDILERQCPSAPLDEPYYADWSACAPPVSRLTHARMSPSPTSRRTTPASSSW